MVFNERVQMNDRSAYIEKVVKKFTDEITDCVFLMIQNDSTLKQEYDDLTRNDIEKHALNCQLGKCIRETFQLSNTGRCGQPKSTLISSYERHKV